MSVWGLYLQFWVLLLGRRCEQLLPCCLFELGLYCLVLCLRADGVVFPSVLKDA